MGKGKVLTMTLVMLWLFVLADIAEVSDTAVAQMQPRSSLQIAERMRDDDMAASHCLGSLYVPSLLMFFEKEAVQTATNLP